MFTFKTQLLTLNKKVLYSQDLVGFEVKDRGRLTDINLLFTDATPWSFLITPEGVRPVLIVLGYTG